ncbi:CIC11C00000004975 [Sungouiella intermedia]|uniref:CIC11C00000004975 n=1 Tax=Sungouiella intermedia TaxID=45354 RepID=A0A1L0DSY6_9ASCO|nr:CIC11C00000004975 [[Candida] intermedia]
MQFKTVVLALTAASAVSAANATNGTNGTNGTSTSAGSGAVQVASAGFFGVAAAAGVAMLI